jgi:hypothetical protein
MPAEGVRFGRSETAVEPHPMHRIFSLPSFPPHERASLARSAPGRER